MSPSTSNAEHNNLLAELRKNSIPDVETVQDLYNLYFPNTLHLASEKMEDGLWALGCSIEHQLDIPQKPGETIRQALAQIHYDLKEIVTGYSLFTVLDKMSVIARLYLLLLGYKRRLVIIQPAPLSGRFIASVPYKDYAVGDHRFEDALWLYYDDRRANSSGRDPLFAGVCIPERDRLPYHRGCILDKSSPSAFAIFESQAESLFAGFSTKRTRSSDFIGSFDPEKFFDLCFGDTDEEEGDITYGPTPRIPPRNPHPNNADVSDMSSDWYTTDDESASSHEDEDSEVAFIDPNPTSTHSHDVDIDDPLRGISCDAPGEDDARSSPHPMPPSTAPTSPATVCWNCSGLGHLSSQCASSPVCHNCGGSGHVARACRAPFSACPRCKFTGHLESFCRIVSASRANRNARGNRSGRFGRGHERDNWRA